VTLSYAIKLLRLNYNLLRRLTKQMPKKKQHTQRERAKLFKPTYFFGYGSLMYPPGLNCRGIRHHYTWEDLAVARLVDYERGMSAFFGDRNFYGILPKKGSHLNGIVFRMPDWYSYRSLLGVEGATSFYGKFRTYVPVEVAGKIKGWEVPKGFRVITLVCPSDKTGLGRIMPWYAGEVWNGIQHWGGKFVAEFLKTGGLREAPKVKRRVHRG